MCLKNLADGSVTLELLPGDTWSACWRVYCVLWLSLRLQQGDPSTGRQEVLVASPQALENCQEALRELTVAYHDTWWLLVRVEDQARGERLASARATRLAAHKASGGAAHTFDASWSGEFNTVAGDDKFLAAQVRYPAWDFLARGAKAPSAVRRRVRPSRGSRQPTTVALQSLIVSGRSAPASATAVTDRSSKRHQSHRLQKGTRFTESGRVHTTSAATRAHVSCR